MGWRSTLEYMLNAGRDPSLVLPKDFARIRVVSAISYIYLFTGIILSVFHFSAGLPILSMILTTGIIIGLINLYVLFRYDVINLNAHGMVAIIFAVGIGTNITWGGLSGANFSWLIFVPILAAMSISFRAMWIYVALLIIYMIIVITLQQQGIVPLYQDHIPHEDYAIILNRFALLALVCTVLQAFYSERIRYENKINESSRRARIANQQKDAFIATITHEIRTPLTGIVGMAELLINTKQTSDQKYYTRVIHEAGHSLINFVNDTLDYSKIEAGKLPIRMNKFSLQSCVENTLSILAKQAQDKNIDLNYYIPPDLPAHILGDELRYKQVLSNLVANAVKFTDKGEVNIRVTYELQSNHEVLLTTHVKDTGLGISKANQKKIFECFTQADDSILSKFGGTGLGLTIAERLTHLMGGTISVESQLGKGSDFSFICKFKLPNAMSGTDVLLTNRPYSALCIAVLEPDKELIVRTLESWNIHCTTTQSGVIGTNIINERIAQHNPIDFIFIEHSEKEQPEYIELFEILSRQTHKTHIVELSKLSDISQGKVTAFGLIHHLQKPIRQSELYSIVLAACGASTKIPDNQGTEEKLSIDGGHVLVAEDNVINQALIKAQLENLNISCDMVSDGQQAIYALEKHHYDLVIMDCHMPIMDGVTATKAIRASNSDYQHIPIIALTADSLSHEFNHCISAGMDDFIIKPFRQIDFKNALSRWMKGKHIDEP